MEISELIRMGLKRKGITQSSFAEKIGVSPPSVAAWISGKSYPGARKLIEVIKILDLKEDFFGSDFLTKEDELFLERMSTGQGIAKEVSKLHESVKDLQKKYNEQNNNSDEVAMLKYEKKVLESLVGISVDELIYFIRKKPGFKDSLRLLIDKNRTKRNKIKIEM